MLSGMYAAAMRCAAPCVYGSQACIDHAFMLLGLLLLPGAAEVSPQCGPQEAAGARGSSTSVTVGGAAGSFLLGGLTGRPLEQTSAPRAPHRPRHSFPSNPQTFRHAERLQCTFLSTPKSIQRPLGFARPERSCCAAPSHSRGAAQAAVLPQGSTMPANAAYNSVSAACSAALPPANAWPACAAAQASRLRLPTKRFITSREAAGLSCSSSQLVGRPQAWSGTAASLLKPQRVCQVTAGQSCGAGRSAAVGRVQRKGGGEVRRSIQGHRLHATWLVGRSIHSDLQLGVRAAAQHAHRTGTVPPAMPCSCPACSAALQACTHHVC
jgi:hypothetical protein